MRLTKKLNLDKGKPSYCEPTHLEEYTTKNKHLAINKLGQLEDIEERLSKYEEIGIDGLVDLFNNLTDEDIEYIVQLAFKKRKTIYSI